MESAAGFVSIIKLTWLTLRKTWKHFLCIASLWVIASHAFHSPLLDICSINALDVLVGMLNLNYELLVSKDQILPPSGLASYNSSTSSTNHLPHSDPVLHLSSFFPMIATLFLFIIISLISYPLLTFSVCRAFLNKPVSFKSSLLGVPRSAKNLVLTTLCIGVAMFGLAMVAIGIGLTAVMVGAIVMSGPDKVARLLIFWSCIATAMAVVGVYLTVLFSLANTAAILEERTRGWKAMKRSMDLLEGRKWLAVGLVCVFYVLLQPCTFSELWQWRGAQTVRASLQATITMFGMAANTVMYMICKSAYEEEPGLDTLVAAGVQFGPQSSLPQSQATFTTTLPY